MKLTKETLKRIIKEELDISLEEGDRIATNLKRDPQQITTADPSLSIDQTDPNDGLFRIMDQVQDKAMKYLNLTDRELKDRGLDFEFSEMSNEVVTARLQDIDGMAQELMKKFQNHVGKGTNK